MQVAITGGRGFIGSILVKHHLQHGDDVRILTRKVESHPDDSSTQLEIYHADLTKQSKVLNDFVDGVDVLYHCAGESNNEDLMYQTHVEGTKYLIAVAAGKIGRWVQLSSVGVYGQQFKGSVREDSELKPVGTYETTKMLSEQLVMDAGNEKSFSWIILRPSTVYGSTMTNQSLHQLVSRINRSQFFFIGRAGASANYIHVDNVIQALYLCASCESHYLGSVYNLSDYVHLEDFVTMISDNLGLVNISLRIPEWPIRFITRILENIPGFPLTTSRINALTNRANYPITKISNDLGYQAVVSMQEGIRQFITSWKETH